MKNRKFTAGIAAVMLAFGSGAAGAQGFTDPGGFTGPESGLSPVTVSEAKKLPDDTPVVLQGKVTSRLNRKKEKFVFRDSTGEIVVEIDRHIWNGLSVSGDDTVEISGYIHKKGWRVELIEVKSIRKL